MRFSIISSAFIAVLVGVTASVAVVLAAAQAIGASDAETSSMLFGLCVALAVSSAYLSWAHKMPVVTAWSTPGAAVIAVSSGVEMAEATGAFIFVALLIMITAFFKPLARLVENIPGHIAGAMLAGILFGFVIGVFDFIADEPFLIVMMLLTFLLVRFFFPGLAIVTALALGALFCLLSGKNQPIPDGPIFFSEIVWQWPQFDVAVLVGLGLPLYLVTMASQNIAGFSVLKQAGYALPVRSGLSVTGGLSLITAFCGAHTSNLAAITASIVTGPDVHPDPDKRWVSGVFYGGFYLLLAIFASSFVAFFTSFPAAFIAVLATIGLAAPLTNALVSSFSGNEKKKLDDAEKFASMVTFAVCASSFSFLGVGAAFWGLIVGVLVVAYARFAARTKKRSENSW